MGNNVVERTKNPFLGTFALVWLARNWELIFALFNFDKSYTLETKLQFLSDRIQYGSFWSELGWNVLWTFTILIITYALINAARAISNLFEKRLTPLIYEWTDYKSLVPKEEYLRLNQRISDLEIDLEREQEKRYKAEAKVKELEDRESQKLEQLKYPRLANLPDEMEEKSENPEPVEERSGLNSNEDKLINRYGRKDVENALSLALNELEASTDIELTISNDLYKLGYMDSRFHNRYYISDSGKDFLKRIYE